MTASTPLALRRRRKSVVVVVGHRATGDVLAQGLADTLGELGIETIYLGTQECARHIALVVADEAADSVELCLGDGAGVPVLRQLLRELSDVGRRNVSIVVRRLG